MTKIKDTSTPLMKQYWEIKSAHSDKILFFRMGDFFEMFFDDAVTAAPLLGIALTSRNKKALDETPMCGLPHHAVAAPINKLLSLGYKVAICDQIEDPKTAKGIVKRAVTRILTPGMVFDSDTLDATEAHYIACIEDQYMAFVDPTTGEAFYFKSLNSERWIQLLQVLPVAELVVSGQNLAEWKQKSLPISLSVHSELLVNDQLLQEKDLVQEPSACSRLRSYIRSLGNDETLSVINIFEKREWQQRLELSPTTLRHLEVYETYKGESKGSLFRAVNRTQTAAGGRLLRQWLAFPLRDLEILRQRLDQVEYWKGQLNELKDLRKRLAQIGDIERRLSRLVTPQSQARDLLSLAQATQASLAALDLAKGNDNSCNNLIRFSKEDLDIFQAQSLKILNAIRDDAPISTKQGHLIREGVSPELDEIIRLTQDTQSLLSELEAREKASTGISSLKIRYNNVFGYYIEITNTHKDKVPDSYKRKQTLTNAERYCTDELIELEKKVLAAQSKRADLEWSIYDQIRREVIGLAQNYLALAHHIAAIDVLSSLSWLAIEQKYCRPLFNDQGSLNLRGARHPVVEQEGVGTFIPNNIHLESGNCMLLTGPNMAGKSTLMRQVAVIAMMAQMGSFVPCEQAEIPLFDQIFTRIGASDHLAEGLSTFMVEMSEAAEIIKKCTSNSLVILDEIGRGTSTFDGLSLAQSILEHLVTQKKSITFFATHYHELTELEGSYPHLFNYHMSVSEKDSAVQFLHTLAKGPALKSYGIYVAELAGIPNNITKRAKALLKKIESQKITVSSQMSFEDYFIEEFHGLTPAMHSTPATHQMTPPVSITPAVIDAKGNAGEAHATTKICNMIKDLNLEEITPLKAFSYLTEWKEELSQ